MHVIYSHLFYSNSYNQMMSTMRRVLCQCYRLIINMNKFNLKVWILILSFKSLICLALLIVPLLSYEAERTNSTKLKLFFNII